MYRYIRSRSLRRMVSRLEREERRRQPRLLAKVDDARRLVDLANTPSPRRDAHT